MQQLARTTGHGWTPAAACPRGRTYRCSFDTTRILDKTQMSPTAVA